MTPRLSISSPCCLAILLSACSGSPSAPETVQTFKVGTPHGTVTVGTTLACSTSTEAEIHGEIGQGYRRALRETEEASAISVDGLLIHVMAQRSPAVWYNPPEDRVEYGCGDEGAIEHEMGHRIAYFLGRSCFREVWHSVDLNCAPI